MNPVPVARPSGGSHPAWGAFQLVAKVAVTAGLLAFLISKLDLKATAAEISSIGLGAFAVVTAISFLLSSLMSIRWRSILAVMNSPAGLFQCWRLIMIGQFFNQVLPSSIGGDAVRIWLCTRLGHSFRVSFLSVALDRLFALMALGLCVGLALPSLWDSSIAVLAVLVFAGVVVGSLVLLVFDDAIRWAGSFIGDQRPGVIARAIGFLRDASRTFGAILRRPNACIAVLGVSLINQLSLGLIVYLIAQAIGAKLALLTAMSIFPLALLLSMIPISLGGWGVREAAMVWLFGAAGVHAQEAISISVLFGLVTMAAGLPGGVFWLLEHRSTGLSPAISLGGYDGADAP